MRVMLRFILLLLLVLVLGGCAKGGEARETEITLEPPAKTQLQLKIENSEEVKVRWLASEKKLPSDFNEAAYRRKLSPAFEYLVARAEDEAAYNLMWSYFDLAGKPSKVDFEGNDVFFVGFHESGSCPSKLKDVRLAEQGEELMARIALSGETCTGDATPRTVVFEIGREYADSFARFVIVDGNIETTVPLYEMEY